MTDIYVLPEKGLFPLGDFYVTAAVERTLSPDDIATALARHARGDWGDVSDADWAENEASLSHGLRLFSVYHDRTGVKFWIITEADRSARTVLLPDDY